MKPYLLILSFFFSSGLFAQNGNTKLGSWHISDKVEISDYQVVRKSGLYFYISNDIENVYVDLMFDNHETQNMILTGGMIIWINMDGKPAKMMGVRYPAGSLKQQTRNKPVYSESNVNQDGNPGTLVSVANTIELIGFISEQERRFPSQNADNFRGSVRFDAGILFYRMIMPISKLPVRNSKEGGGAMPFALGIEYGFPVDIIKPEGKQYIGRNARVQQTAAGSELHWIKNIRLATSK